MADKKGLPEILDNISRRQVMKNVGKGLTGVATNIIVPPLTSVAVKGISTLAKGSSILKKLPMTKLLIKKYFKIELARDKLYDKLAKSNTDRVPIKNRTSTYSLRSFYRELKQELREKIDIENRLKNTDIKKAPLEEPVRLQNRLEDLNRVLDIKFRAIEGDSSFYNLQFSKQQKQSLKDLLDLDAQQTEIQVIAKKEKVPFNYYFDKIKNIKRIKAEPAWKESAVKNENWLIDDAFKDTRELESSAEELAILNTPEEATRISQGFLDGTIPYNTSVNQLQHNRTLSIHQKTLDDPTVSNELKNKVSQRMAEIYIEEEKNKLNTSIYSDKVYSSFKLRDPNEEKTLYKTFGNELTKVAKTIGTDYVKEKFITKENKPGPWLKKLADYVKSLKTPKAPSGPTIESDKVRAEQAKEVKEVKQKVTPKRNLVQDLKGVGKVIKASPYVAGTLTALTPTELDPEGTAELPLETSPRGYGVRRENRGRSSRDPNKNYNTQRFI